MKIDSVNIIGLGKVGSAFLNLLRDKNVQIKTVLTSKYEAINLEPNIKVVKEIQFLDNDVDLNIICVKDGAIPEIVDRLPKGIPAVHTSGSVPLSVFSDFDSCGIFYPLQTFTENRSVDLNSSYFLIEATSGLEKPLRKFCETYFSKNVLFCNSDQRAKIHLAAVFANNFVNHLLLCSKDILDNESIDFKILEPLVIETVSKAFDLGPSSSQTGPAVRKDNSTIKKHIELIKDEHLKKIYDTLTESIKRSST